MWLQTAYPKAFDGVWAFAPDPIDFRNWTNVNLTASPPENFFRDSHNNALRSCRTLRLGDTCTHEQLLAEIPFQFVTFNYVFSPRAESGYAARLFDLKTGAIDATVAAYWEAHYDISARVVANWSTLAPDLTGKMHIVVGDADTYHLDESVRLFEGAISPLGAKASITYVHGSDHWGVLSWDGGYESHILMEVTGENVR
jgi:hypothetical protein